MCSARPWATSDIARNTGHNVVCHGHRTILQLLLVNTGTNEAYLCLLARDFFLINSVSVLADTVLLN